MVNVQLVFLLAAVASEGTLRSATFSHLEQHSVIL